MKNIQTLSLFLILSITLKAQTEYLPCSYNSFLKSQTKTNSDIETEMEKNEKFISNFLNQIKKDRQNNKWHKRKYIIPVVMHVFHFGNDGKMNMDQILSGLKILNEDFNGLNDGWGNIDPEFDKIKGTLNITFCLATIDPKGNSTTGVVYYEDKEAMLNKTDLMKHAWDNFKYFNIYFPKYAFGEPSDFTAFAKFPNLENTKANKDGVVYSSIRWGYGEHSELEDGHDWASVGTHEVGHWLNLQHTFNGGCNGKGDYVEDTPPSKGSGIEKEGCNNNDFSCGVHTNGENFMDYNHSCKKMFTKGQVDRMLAALELPSRKKLWSYENLTTTGCINVQSTNQQNSPKKIIGIFPNPAKDHIIFQVGENNSLLKIYNVYGEQIDLYTGLTNNQKINLRNYPSGLYFFQIQFKNHLEAGKFVVKN